MTKVKKAKFVLDKELSGLDSVKPYKQIAETEEAYKNILEDAVITRTATSGSRLVEESVKYNVTDIEADYDFPVYKYVVDGKEYFSNFQFANYVDIINPINNTDV